MHGVARRTGERATSEPDSRIVYIWMVGSQAPLGTELDDLELPQTSPLIPQTSPARSNTTQRTIERDSEGLWTWSARVGTVPSVPFPLGADEITPRVSSPTLWPPRAAALLVAQLHCGPDDG